MTEKRYSELAYKGVVSEIEKECDLIANSCFNDDKYKRLKALLEDYETANEFKEKHRFDE